MKNAPVIIVGAGATGLFLGLCLAKSGVDFVLLEKETKRNPHSRSIGIHPPLLGLLADLDVDGEFLRFGNAIRFGRAVTGNGISYNVDFAEAGAHFPFILTLQQPETEAILESALLDVAPDAVMKGVSDFRILEEGKESVTCTWSLAGKVITQKTPLVIGCDGKRSSIREQAGIAFKGGPYSDTYVMCDVPDKTGKPDTGLLFFHRDGVVESFPLPGGMRRWVVKTERFSENPLSEAILQEVHRRTGYLHENNRVTMTSGFGVQHFLAETFVKGRIVLAGDAAHIISPIGGQGMNLGWLDARHLADVLAKHRDYSSLAFRKELLLYNTQRRNKTRLGMASAWFNMAFGRRFPIDSLRSAAIKLMLLPPVRGFLLRRFTMYGLLTRA
jgi:2-polyprenyl-6-methoxyphenol hydroxylase-like FAD-dependent oxidoreductase